MKEHSVCLLVLCIFLPYWCVLTSDHLCFQKIVPVTLTGGEIADDVRWLAFGDDWICRAWPVPGLCSDTELLSVYVLNFTVCRFLTSWSGGTSTWRKGLRRRSRRWEETTPHPPLHFNTYIKLNFSSRLLLPPHCPVAAAVFKRLHRVWAQQAGHADGHPAGQREYIRLHPEQPLQREPG